MKIFTNKKIIHKVLIVLIVLLLFNFIMPNSSRADDVGIGGALFRPILDLLVGLADWVISFLQQSIFGMHDSFIYVDRGNAWWSTIFGVAVGIVAIAGCVALSIALEAGSGGAATPLVAALMSGVAGFLSSGGVLLAVGAFTFFGVKTISSDMLPSDFNIPLIQISPETIFSRRNTNI